MNGRVAILSLFFCLPLVWTIDINELCGVEEDFQCGHNCIKGGATCTCGDTSWKGGKNTTVDGCCPYSPNSCIKDDKEGKKRILHTFNFEFSTPFFSPIIIK